MYNWYDGGIKQLNSGMTLLDETFQRMSQPETAHSFGMDIELGTEYWEKRDLMAGGLWKVWGGFIMPEQCTVEVWTARLPLF
jgi:hypothetical protein